MPPLLLSGTTSLSLSLLSLSLCVQFRTRSLDLDKATREGGGGREGRTGHRESQWRATMGQGLSFDLTQEEIEDLQDSCDSKFTQTEIQILYKRFLKLDKDKKGFISPEELLALPDLFLNPLAQRFVSLFENVNFKDFLNLLSAFSPKATKDEKLRFMFNFHDVDGDGYVSRLDLEHVLRQRVGASLNEEEMDKFLTKVMEDSGSKQERLDFKTFCKCFVEDEDFSMDVDIPSDDELG